ncbi:MAG TPA: hypothetical protein VGD73_25185 [Pseudonocardia sp.]|uniref:hypothetical protein n=1 Tax=Pseudonocardia sp. TaxID=60912 RepID=UPI002EDA6A38
MRTKLASAAALVALVLAAVVLTGCGSAPSPPEPGPPAGAPPPTSFAVPAPPPSSPPPQALPSAAPTSSAKPAAGRKLQVELTGYSFHDNTPPGSAEVCCSVLHSRAGGQGTYADPITVAVPGGAGGMAWRAGTRFYLPTVRRYVIVEDYGASAADPGVDTHLDMWIDGRDGDEDSTQACMAAITARVPAELNPPPGRPVMSGPIYSGGSCRIPGGGG